jgi:MIP family channel proteins
MDKYLRNCIAELVGTFFLCFIGAGVICADKTFPNAGIGLLGIAIAHGLALSIGVSATMNVSGGHLNPAVTITMWVYKKIDTDQAIYYVISQLLGGVIAGGLIVLFYGSTGGAMEAGFGTPHVTVSDRIPSISGWQLQLYAIAVEAVLTFILVFSIFGTAVDPRAPKIGGFGIGLAIAMDILVGGPLTGASMNPARTLGPGVWEAGIRGFEFMKDSLVYVIGPVIGGILAGGLYINYILPPEQPKHVITEGRK